MSNHYLNQSKTSIDLKKDDFPTLISSQPQKPLQIQSQTETKKEMKKSNIDEKEFPSLTQNPLPPSQVQPKQPEPKKEKNKPQDVEKEFQFPALNPSPIILTDGKQVWELENNPRNGSSKNQIKKNLSCASGPKKIESPLKLSNPLLSMPVEPLKQQNERSRSLTSEIQQLVDFSSESESDSEESENEVDFQAIKQKINKVQQFKIPLYFPTVEHYRFEKAPNQMYSTHYEKARVHQYFKEMAEDKKWTKWVRIGKFRILSINCDFNIPSRNEESSGTDDSDGYPDFKRIVKEYWRTSEEERAQQIVKQIKLAIFQGVDFICLQEICLSTIRDILLQTLEDLKQSGQNQYFFPKNLESHQFLRTTMILSKYPAKFGHLKFEIPQYIGQDPSKYYFPLQSFIEFEIMIGRKVQKVGILNCHLRSNGQKNSNIRPYKMRKMQVRCIHDFSKRFDRFFCIGDTNIPSSQKFKKENLWVKKKFVDAFDIGSSPNAGTYLYRSKAHVVKQERMDRIWLKKNMKYNTQVKIEFKDVLLQSCKNKNFNKRKMLEVDQERLIYVSPSDHEILDIGIYFTKDE